MYSKTQQQTSQTIMFQRAAAPPLSMRSSVQHHARPFAAQCNNKQRHQRAPAISMTRRRHHVVSASFSVSDITGPVNDTVKDLKSTEVRNFPQLLLYSSSSSSSRELRFVFIFLLFSTIDRSRERDARKTTFFFNSTTRPPHPSTYACARAFDERRRKKGGEEEEEEEEENNGLEDGIRFDSSFFFFVRRRLWSWGRRLSSNRIRLFFPTERKCLVSISFLFFSFLSRGREGRGRFFFNF